MYKRQIQEASQAFLAHEKAALSGTLVDALTKLIESRPLLKTIKDETRARCYEAKEVLEIELAGYEVLYYLLETLVGATRATTPSKREEKVLKLLPHDPRAPALSPYQRLLVITDYLSGMTDGYAVSLFRRFRGVALPTLGAR